MLYHGIKYVQAASTTVYKLCIHVAIKLTVFSQTSVAQEYYQRVYIFHNVWASFTLITIFFRIYMYTGVYFMKVFFP